MKKAYKILFILLLVAGIGDCVSTSVGLSRGFVETRSYYFPFLSTLILAGAGSLILLLINKAYRGVGFCLVGCLVVLSFSGLANNLWVLLT